MDLRLISAADQIMKSGYATLSLLPAESSLLQGAFSAGKQFFVNPRDVKGRYSAADLNHGYRPMGHEYSVSPDRPDVNECFVIWRDRKDLIPHADELGWLLTPWAAYRELLDQVVEEVVTLVAKNFGDYHVPEFRSASYLQMNAYTDSTSDRDLLQDAHEDGHMITIHYANSLGLEAKIGEEYQSVVLDADTLLLMPGSILTGLTSGKVPPLYHRVRNRHVTGRGSLMYFVNPSLAQPVYSWSSEGEHGEDLREKIRSNPSMFGLPDVPSL